MTRPPRAKPSFTLKQLVCAAEGCARTAHCWAGNLPACSAHEQRYRAYGSFELPTQNRIIRTICEVEGCGKKPHSKYRSLCRMHYFRLRRGSRLGLKAPRRACAHCGGQLSRNQSRFCSERCSWRHHQNVASVRKCVVCGNQFDFYGTSNTCSEICSRSLIRHHKQVRRALETNSARPREIFFDREIFIRDKFICQICFKPVNPFVCHPVPEAATIDHRVPLSRGGLHTRANVQTAHSSCNLKKRTKFMHELSPAQDVHS